MKGIVFDEFTQMVESEFGEAMLDTLIDECSEQLPSGGAYTTVGTYDHNEILVLVTALSEKVNIPVPDLVKAFGHHLAQAFLAKFPEFFNQCNGAIEFFKTIDNHIHEEVHKLYPDAELPQFSYEQQSEHQLKLTYQSTRDFSMLALGLLEATAKHYGQALHIDMQPEPVEGKTRVCFMISVQQKATL